MYLLVYAYNTGVCTTCWIFALYDSIKAVHMIFDSNVHWLKLDISTTFLSPKRGVSHDPRLVVWEHLYEDDTTTLRRPSHRKRLVGDAADVFVGAMARTGTLGGATENYLGVTVNHQTSGHDVAFQ